MCTIHESPESPVRNPLQLDFKFENDSRLFHNFINDLRARLGESIIEGESNISSNQKLSFV